jgi:hypothetical protein
MNEKKVIEKIYLELDGELNEAEKAELEEYLSAHPLSKELQSQWKEVKKQFEVKQNTGIVPDLKAGILQRINKEQYAPRPAKLGPRIVLSFWERPAYKMGLVFVTGVLTGLLLLAFLGNELNLSTSNKHRLKGTFYDIHSSGKVKSAKSIRFQGPESTATCDVIYTDSIIEMYVDLYSSSPIKSLLIFNREDFELLNIENNGLNDQFTFSVSPKYLQLNSQGENRLIVQLYNKNHQAHFINFRIYQKELPLYQNSITLNK